MALWLNPKGDVRFTQMRQPILLEYPSFMARYSAGKYSGHGSKRPPPFEVESVKNHAKVFQNHKR
jgi:hypothetical protein